MSTKRPSRDRTIHIRFPSVLAIAAVISSTVVAAGYAQTPAGRISDRFRELDTDNNGTLSESEAGRTASVFDAIDTDHDRQLSIREIRDYLRNGGRLGPSTAPDAPPREIVGEFPEDSPITLASCRAATKYSRQAAGHAVLIMINGETVYESYHNGWSGEAAHRLASGTKSFAGVTAAVAAAEGLLRFDEKVSDTITEWKVDPRLSRVTVRQLLSLTSGMDPGENAAVLPYREAIETPAKHAPGSKFEYGPNPFQVFGELMRRKLGGGDASALEYLESKVFGPIGLEIGQWRRTSNGDPHIPSGAFLTAREWAKFGELLRNDRTWDSTQIVDKDLLQELLVGSRANPRYGMTLWLNIQGGVGAGSNAAARTTTPTVDPSKVDDLFMAAGAGKQRLYVIPTLGLTIVRFGESTGKQFRDDAFLEHLLIGL